MKKIPFLLFPLVSVFILSSCSSTEQTTQTESSGKDSVYIFDQVPEDTTTAAAEEPVKTEPAAVTEPASTYFIIQVGAFTTKEKAETFAEASRQKLHKELIIIYSNTVNLFVVQLTNPFSTRAEAEKVRNELWQMNEFKDAWILTVNK